MTEQDLEIQNLRRENAELIHRLRMNDAERVANVQALIEKSQEADRYKRERDEVLHENADLNEKIKTLKKEIKAASLRMCCNCKHGVLVHNEPDTVCGLGVSISGETVLAGNFGCAMWKEDK